MAPLKRNLTNKKDLEKEIPKSAWLKSTEYIVNMGEKQGKVVVFAGEKGVRTLNDRNCVLEVSNSQI